MYDVLASDYLRFKTSLDLAEYYSIYAVEALESPLKEKIDDMTVKMSKFIEEGRIEKYMRWLGFIQGTLWAKGYFTIEQLKEHNRKES